jgi:hypothetical protein
MTTVATTAADVDEDILDTAVAAESTVVAKSVFRSIEHDIAKLSLAAMRTYSVALVQQ